MSTYTDASLIYYPSGYKAGKAYSLKPTDGSGDLDFTRASTATRVNESGLIEEVAANVPRLDNSQGGCSSLLLEPQRTNLFLNSNSTEGFNASNATRTLNQITSPDGSINASSVVCTNNFGNINRGGQAVTAGTKYVYSVFLKLKDTNWAYIRVLSTDLDYFVWIDLLNGIKGTDANSVGSIQDYGNGWFRCNIVFTNISATTANIYAYPTSSNNTTSAIGNSFYAWGIQLEAGSYPTSYIPTTSTAVTRVADASVTTGLTSLIGQTEGTLYWQGSTVDGVGTDLLQINSSNSLLSRVAVYIDTDKSLKLAIRSEGSLVINATSSVQASNTNFKIALIYKSGATKLYYNGTLILTSTTTFSLTDSMSVLELQPIGYTSKASLRTQSTMIFTTILSDAEAIALTTL